VRLASDIDKRGFKPWFERRLIESHVYLVTAFLCLVLVLAVFEELSSRAGGFEQAGSLALILAGSALGVLSWNRYRAILFHALQLAERSVCEKCRAYARFNVIDSGRTNAQDDEQDRGGSWLRVKCKNCGHEWTMG
jgi:hypothetical protein